MNKRRNQRFLTCPLLRKEANKRGISGVVLTIILIGLTLVAVGIVWQVISGILEKGVEDIDVSALKFDLKIERALIQDGNMNVKIKRLSGGGDIDNKIMIVLSNDLGSQEYVTEEGLREVQTKTFSFPLEIFNPTKVEIYPIFVKEGKEEIKSISDTQEFIDTSLVVYYPFDEDAKDKSGNGNNGIVTGAYLNLTGGYDNKGAYEFDGDDDYIESVDSTSIDLDSQVTITAWIKPNVINDWDRVVAKSHTEDLSPWTMYGLLFDDLNHIRMEIATGDSQNIVSGNITIQTNEWTHVVGTYDNISMKVYVNGVLDGSISHSGSIDTNNRPLSIARSSFDSNYFDGIIDEVRIYNRALSEFEIQSIYNQ